jgi:hypothetical protein
LKLRLAGAGDLALLVAQGADFFANVDPRIPRPTPARLAQLIADVLDRGIVIVLEEGAAYVGSLALELSPWAWSEDLVLQDRWLHVRADRRGRGAVRRLVTCGKELARRRGVPLYLGNSLGDGRARLI